MGKKSVPSHIRPDVWNPLAIVTFPNAVQGLEAFRMLREFRMRHEYEWRDHIEDQADLPERKQRIKMLQNQKPNCVADLAATLVLQDRLGEEEFDIRLALLQEKEKSYEEVMQSLQELEMKMANAEEAGEKDTESYRDLHAQITALKTPAFTNLCRYHIAAQEAHDAATLEAEERGLSAIVSRPNKPETNGDENDESQQGEAEKDATKRAMKKYRKDNMMIKKPKRMDLSPRDTFIQHRQLELIPKYLGELRHYRPLPKLGRRRQQMARELDESRHQIPTLNGVKIMWADENDRHYAREWPVAVEHEIMGVWRSQAPDPDRLRYLAQWRQNVPDLLKQFEAREDELLARESFEWYENTEEAEKFLQYLEVRYQQAKQEKMGLGDRVNELGSWTPEEKAIVLDTQAARINIAVVELRANRPQSRPTHSRQYKLRTAQNHDRAACSEVVHAAVVRVKAQEARVLAAEQDGLGTAPAKTKLRLLRKEVKNAIARHEWAELGISSQVILLSSGKVNGRYVPRETLEKKIWLQQNLPVAGLEYSRWKPTRIPLSHAQRVLLARSMLAANKESGNLTAEEEELLKNVELDGESSGKNEDTADEDQDDDSSKATEEQGEREDLERQEKRQNDEKKSLWGRLFSGSSSSSKDEQPRV